MALVRYNNKNLLYFDFRVRLMPGVNEVSESDLKAMFKHPLFEHRFKEGILEVLESEELDNKGKSKKKAKDGKDEKRPAPEMLKLIPEIFDVELLKKIVKTDGREGVVKAAQDQLKKLSLAAEDEERAKESK
jgi:hypothetical protein